MTEGNNRRLFICASLVVVLATLLLFHYYCSDARVWQTNITNMTIFGNMSSYLQRALDSPKGSVVNTSISFNPQQSSYNSELGEVNDNVLKQNVSLSALTSESEVAIFVPYRNRKEHLIRFLTRMPPFLGKQRKQYVISVTEQAVNQSFNRAKLFNIAVKEIEKNNLGDRMHEINCFIFHDVDNVPTSPSTAYECDQNVRQLTTAFRSVEEQDGCTTASWEQLRPCHGSIWKELMDSQIYFHGWGGEDDDLALRLQFSNIAVDRPVQPDGIFDEFDSTHPRDMNPDRIILTSKENFASCWGIVE